MFAHFNYTSLTTILQSLSSPLLMVPEILPPGLLRGSDPPTKSLNPGPQNLQILISQDCDVLLSSYFAGLKSSYIWTILQSLRSPLFRVLGILPPGLLRGWDPRTKSPNPGPRNLQKLISQDCGGLQSSKFVRCKPLYRSNNVQSLKFKLIMVLRILPPMYFMYVSPWEPPTRLEVWCGNH